MATYYFRNVGTDWNTASNWSLTDGGGATGAVPTAADDAYFTSNSGSCTVSTASRVCKTLIFSGVGAGDYSNTFTLNNTLTVSGNITLSSTMTFAGTSTLGINALSTLTSNGTTLTCSLTLTGNLTLGDNVTINGDFRIAAVTITGNTLYIGGGLIQTVNGNTSTLNSNIEMIGTGNISVGTSGASFGGTGTLTINTSGIITITGLSFSGNRSFVYVDGTINVTGNVNFINTSGTLTLDMKGYPLSPPAANTISLATNGGTISFLSDFVMERSVFQFGNSVLAAGQVCVLSTSGGNLYLGKDSMPASITNVASSISNTGTATIYIRGGGVCNYGISAAIPLNMVFDFSGILRINNGTSFGTETTGMTLSTGTYTFLNGRVISQNNALVKNLGRLDITGNATLIGFDKLSGIGNIRITNGVTLTMDKFFSGRPDCISNIFCATVTGAYTVTFQDTFEKFSNWVKVSNCTLSRRGQLLILNQRGVNNTARNTGVRYVNSWPNGAPKHSPFTPDNSTAYSAGGLLADPAISL
jgi:hypothetical protein